MRPVLAALLVCLVATIAICGEEPPSTENGTVSIVGENVLDTFRRGGEVMYVILALSIAGLAFCFEAIIKSRRAAILPGDLAKTLRELTGRARLDRIEELAERHGNESSLARVVRAGLHWRTADHTEVVIAVEEAADAELWRLRRSIRPLGIIATLSPLLGLLGTVLGMIEAFDTVATSGRMGNATPELAAGIAKALLTTGFGLIVAIPCLGLYHYFSGRLEVMMREAEELVKEAFIPERPRGGASKRSEDSPETSKPRRDDPKDRSNDDAKA